MDRRKLLLVNELPALATKPISERFSLCLLKQSEMLTISGERSFFVDNYPAKLNSQSLYSASWRDLNEHLTTIF